MTLRSTDESEKHNVVRDLKVTRTTKEQKHCSNFPLTVESQSACCERQSWALQQSGAYY